MVEAQPQPPPCALTVRLALAHTAHSAQQPRRPRRAPAPGQGAELIARVLL